MHLFYKLNMHNWSSYFCLHNGEWWKMNVSRLEENLKSYIVKACVRMFRSIQYVAWIKLLVIDFCQFSLTWSLGRPLWPHSDLLFSTLTLLFRLAWWILWPSKMNLSRLNWMFPWIGFDLNLQFSFWWSVLECLNRAFDLLCCLISDKCSICLLWSKCPDVPK